MIWNIVDIKPFFSNDSVPGRKTAKLPYAISPSITAPHPPKVLQWGILLKPLLQNALIGGTHEAYAWKISWTEKSIE
jgi:hypothetical protein